MARTKWSFNGKEQLCNIITGVLVGLVLFVIGKPWADKKLQDITTKISGDQNQVISIGGKLDSLIQAISTLSQKQTVSGDRSQALQIQGNNNPTSQNITEIKTDFKQDTPQSSIVVKQIEKGIAIYHALMKCSPTDEEMSKLRIQFNDWHIETGNYLTKVSEKASVYFLNTDYSGPGMSYTCGQEAGELRAVIRKYLNSLNDILKTS